MSSYACFIFFFLFSSFLTSFIVYAQTNHTYIYNDCSTTKTFTRNTTFSTNLQTLLSSLSSRNASYSTGFQNATAGDNPDKITGLFLCRGDLSPEVCRSCVAFAFKDILRRCPNEREAVVYYDQCILRYSDQIILSTLITAGAVRFSHDQNVSNVRFNDVLMPTLNQAVKDAVTSSRKFDARKANFTASQTLYVMVQCTPDLTSEDCSTCLLTAINQIPTDKIGGRFLMPSCNSRFGLYSFYNESAIRTPPPQPPPPSPVSAPPRSGKRGKSNVLVLAIVVFTIVAVLLLLF